MTDRRVVASFIETWEGRYSGFQLVEVVEELGKPMRLVRGKAQYLHQHPAMREWHAIHKMAAVQLAVACLPKRKRK